MLRVGRPAPALMDSPRPSPAPVVEIDGDGVVVAASPAAAALLGVPVRDAVGRPFEAWVAGPERSAVRSALGRVRAGDADDVTLRAEGSTNVPLWISLRRDGAGRVVGRVRGDRRPAAEAAPTAHADRLRLLAHVMSRADAPFEDVVAQTLALTTELLGLEIGVLAGIEGDAYTVAACYAPDADLAAGDRFALGDTYCSITLERGDLLSIEHMSGSPYHRHPCFATFGLETYVGAPVYLGGAPWGTLCFSSSEPRSLTDADRDLVRVLAVWASGALERRAQMAELADRERQVQAVITAAPVVLFALDADGVFTLCEGHGLQALGLRPNELVGQSLFEVYGDAPETAAAVRAGLAGEPQSWIAHLGPLVYESWASPVRDGDGRIAGLTGVSVDVTRLHEAQRQVRREAERLRRLLDVTAQDGPFEELATAVLAEMTDLLGLQGGLLARVDGSDYVSVAGYRREGEAPAPGTVYPLHETYCDLALSRGDVVAIDHMARSEHRDHPCYAAVGLEAYVGAPIVVDGTVYGAISFSSTEPAAAPFTESDKELVRLAAQWARGLLEREARESALTESEGRLRALSASTTEAICFASGGVIFDCNDQFARLVGLTRREDLFGTQAGDYVAPEYAAKVYEMVLQNRTEPYEIVGVRADGGRFWAEVQGGPTLYEGRVVRMTAIRDISKRKAAEAQTRFQASVLAQVSEAVVAVGLDGRVTYWNGGAERLHDVAASDALGRPLLDLAPYLAVGAGTSALRALDAVGARGGDAVQPLPGGGRRFLAVTTDVLHEEGGTETGRLAVVRDVTDQREMAARLRHQASHDVLTGLPNRALFQEYVETALAAGGPFAVLFVDLDHFKVVNDSLGHEAGDRLLRAVADRLPRAVSDHAGAVVARFGGDEFAVLLRAPAAEAEAAGRALLAALAAPVDLGERAVSPAASVGVVGEGRRYDSPEALLRDADTAMYAAKHGGRGRLAVFDPSMHEAARLRFQTEHDLRHAVDRGQLRIHLQPIVDLRTGGAVGFESLIRWEHPERGLLAPGQFVPLAEELGLVADLDRWVLDATCREIGGWRCWTDEALVMVSVNCSDQAFLAERLAERARAAVDAAGIPPDRFVLELTERALIDSQAAQGALGSIREHGLQLCVDDFGSGYSSLGLLHALPVDGLKIDRSFVGDLERSREARAVVRAVVGLSEELGLRAVAEGIETPGQLRALRRAGARLGQGYLFSKPVPPAEARAMLAAPPWADSWNSWTS